LLNKNRCAVSQESPVYIYDEVMFSLCLIKTGELNMYGGVEASPSILQLGHIDEYQWSA
jgi:hypothetical protein